MQELYLWAFYIGVTTAFFAIHAAQLLCHRQRTRLQTILGWLMVMWAILNAKDLLALFPTPTSHEMHHYFVMLDGWVTFTYTILLFELTAPGWATRRRALAVSLPFVAFIAAYVVWPGIMTINIYILFLIIYTLALFIIAFVRAHRYMCYIRSNYSNTDGKDITWLRQILLLALVSQTTWLISSFFPSLIGDSVYYVCTLFMWQIVIIYSRRLRQEPMVHEPAVCQPAPQPQENARPYAFAGLLEELVERNELYLNPEITLTDLAKAANTNRTYLSAYFSNVKQTTFYDYINQLRITKKCLPMMREHPEYTLDYVAAASGFKSISTFRRAFIKLTGTSPSQYNAKA